MAGGIGGHYGSSGGVASSSSSLSASVSLAVMACSSPDKDRPPARQPLPDLPESSLSCVLAVHELVIVVVAGGVRQNSGYLE